MVEIKTIRGRISMEVQVLMTANQLDFEKELDLAISGMRDDMMVAYQRLRRTDAPNSDH